MNLQFEDLSKRLSPTLKRIVHKLNGHFSFFDDDDLFQEAMIHLWALFQQGKLDDKTDSYVLQGCYFHLKNYIRKSVDKANFVSLSGLVDQEGLELEELVPLEGQSSYDRLGDTFLMDEARRKGLTKREEEVLSLSLNGLTVREIGHRLGVSHVAIIKVKKKLRIKLEDFKIRP